MVPLLALGILVALTGKEAPAPKKPVDARVYIGAGLIVIGLGVVAFLAIAQ